jgi:hypothetical protein
MKNIVIILIASTGFSTIQVSAYSNKSAQKVETFKPNSAKTTKGKPKTKKPEYYQGHSFGLQNYPGKTIDPGANTGMLPTNSSSPLMGNDITF